ncbi:heavy metal sensor histidine kinase [Sphaerotilus sulfidivorans]|jgi:two-component system heavy metal sensor histidine kinase CusS|nr:two-component sensor histidine kinase [Sphaerotilus natans]HPG78689.1 heavy metal sensor histidine kinase [Piscinibacter sp.]
MSRSRIGSLGRRLSYWLALQSLAGLVVVCAAVYGATHLGFQARQSEQLVQKQVQLRHLLAESARDGDVATLRHKLDDFFIGHPDMALALTRASDGTEFYRRASPPPKGNVRVAQFTLPAPAPEQGSLDAVLALDIQEDAALLRRIGLTLAAAALAGTLLVSAGGFLLVRLGLRPLRDLVNQTRLLAADTLHRRLDGSAQPEELEPLIAQFNELLGRLELAYEQLEGFNADVAHELCTPLATLIGSTELALRKARDADELRDVLGSNLEELQRVAGIIHDMLFLSQADRGASARRVPTPSLAALAQQVFNYHEAALVDAGLTLEVVGDAEGSFDTPLLQRALSNLIGNATRYARRDSAVRVEITRAPTGEVQLMVVNRGVTIEPNDLPRLFDRFYRGDASRTDANRNHGLGLSIVAAIARMHGGRPLATSSAGISSIGISLKDAAAASGLPSPAAADSAMPTSSGH